MNGQPWQVLADCAHCRVEAGVVEEMDPLHPACHLGVPARRRCRLCRWEEAAAPEPFAPRDPVASGRCPACRKRLGEAARSGEGPCPHCGYGPRIVAVREAQDLTDASRARHALVAWALEEGSDDVEAFCVANTVGGVDDVVRRLQAREPVPTTFDVIAFLFPGAGAGAASDGPPRVVDGAPAIPTEEVPVAPARPMDPRTPARVLVSVMVADGSLRAGERAFVVRWLEREGLPPMGPDDLRVWRPSELGSAPDGELRDRLMEAAVHLMHLDRERDGSEWRVIRTFARAWGITEASLSAWDLRYDRRYSGPMARLGRLLDGLFS